MEKQINTPKLRFPGFEEEWVEKKLRETSEIIGGGTPDTFNEKYWNGDINWFTPTELKTKYVNQSKRKISLTGLKQSSAKIMPIGTILFSSRATIGDTSIAQKECTTNQGFQSFIVNSNNNNEFVYYWINLNKAVFLKQASGSTFLEISKSEISKIKIIIPSLPEQTKIANFLTAVDDKITQLKKKKSLLEQYKKGVMQQIFSQKLRFKDENGEDFAEWEEKKLGKICRIYDGTHQTPTYVENGIPFYSVEHVTANDFTKSKYITNEVYIKENQRVKLERGDILMTRIGDIGTAKHINWDVEASFYVSLALIKQTKKHNNEFISHYIGTQYFQKELHKRTIHVAFPKKINLGEIGECLINLPCLKEQTKIANFLSAIDDKINHCGKQIEKMESWKKGLLQKMFV
jgi:type I restriction enzyme S subunit